MINKEGKILSYDIKSSCVPFQDEVFKKEVEEVLSEISFSKLPKEYNFDLIAYTIKFHTKLPDAINFSRINWDSYGFADIELDSKKYIIIPRRIRK